MFAGGRGRLCDPVNSPAPHQPPNPAIGPVTPRPALSPLWFAVGPLLVALLAATIYVSARPAPYIALLPGSARAVEPLVTVTQDGDGPEPEIDASATKDDSLLFVTVSVRRPSGIETLFRLLDDTNDVVPEKIVTGGQSQEENRSFNLQLMVDSQDKATKVALERAGYEVKVTANGAVVVNLDPSYPVADVVTPGDTIIEAAGTPIATSADLVDVIADQKPGDPLALKVLGFGAAEERTVSTDLAANPETGQAQLGVSLEDRPEYDFPFTVKIDSGDVGGPSAGLAFTLAILDQLTPGDLTGDGRVAVTGTIELDGTVGPVGGVKQKTEAAIDAGAKVFIVPTDEFADATAAARGRLEVRQVTDLGEALSVLVEVGGDPVPDRVPASEATAGG